MEFPLLFLKTVLLRPYVFAFLTLFLLSAIVTMGLRRTLVFFLSTWLLAFLSEFSSTRIGFPYGLYHYTESTRGEELFLFNVPFMDSLSYTFLLFASMSTALVFLFPLRETTTVAARQSWKTLVLTALLMMTLDFVIDPVALQGEKWFLGRIYFYEEAGAYFGVPITNALGWGLVGLVAMFVYQRIEKRWFGPQVRDLGIRRFKGKELYGVGLYYAVLLFNLAVTGWIGERGLLIAGIFVYLVPTALLYFRLAEGKGRDGFR